MIGDASSSPNSGKWRRRSRARTVNARDSGTSGGWKRIRADRAHANLELKFGPDAAPGHGVTVGMLDTGIDAAHFQFRNKNVVERFLLGGTGDDGTRFSHGTAVASVIAGEETPGFEFEARGVAPGVDLVVFAVPAGDPPDVYVPIEASELPEAAGYIVETVGAAADWRYGDRSIDFLNVSLAYSGIVENYSEEDLRAHFAPALAAIAQEGSEEKLVLVWAAGNANGLALRTSRTPSASADPCRRARSVCWRASPHASRSCAGTPSAWCRWARTTA